MAHPTDPEGSGRGFDDHMAAADRSQRRTRQLASDASLFSARGLPLTNDPRSKPNSIEKARVQSTAEHRQQTAHAPGQGTRGPARGNETTAHDRLKKRGSATGGAQGKGWSLGEGPSKGVAGLSRFFSFCGPLDYYLACSVADDNLNSRPAMLNHRSHSLSTYECSARNWQGTGKDAMATVVAMSCVFQQPAVFSAVSGSWYGPCSGHSLTPKHTVDLPCGNSSMTAATGERGASSGQAGGTCMMDRLRSPNRPQQASNPKPQSPKRPSTAQSPQSRRGCGNRRLWLTGRANPIGSRDWVCMRNCCSAGAHWGGGPMGTDLGRGREGGGRGRAFSFVLCEWW